jgi:type VI secretion system protein ImpL
VTRRARTAFGPISRPRSPPCRRNSRRPCTASSLRAWGTRAATPSVLALVCDHRAARAGKTTALRSSGLPFPHAKGGRVRGVGGTRNCDWWLTNDAVILDTAGRWATQDDDREEWLAFLDLLHQTRPQEAGERHLGRSERDRSAGRGGRDCGLEQGPARTSRRGDGATGNGAACVPAGHQVRSCPGIRGDVRRSARQGARPDLGLHPAALAATADERIEMFGEHLDELCDVIEQKAALRMYDERRVEARFSIFEFPATAHSPAAEF